MNGLSPIFISVLFLSAVVSAVMLWFQCLFICHIVALKHLFRVSLAHGGGNHLEMYGENYKTNNNTLMIFVDIKEWCSVMSTFFTLFFIPLLKLSCFFCLMIFFQRLQKMPGNHKLTKSFRNLHNFPSALFYQCAFFPPSARISEVIQQSS